MPANMTVRHCGFAVTMVPIRRRTAGMVVQEILSRNLRGSTCGDRRAVARYSGLTGSPTQAGVNAGR